MKDDQVVSITNDLGHPPNLLARPPIWSTDSLGKVRLDVFFESVQGHVRKYGADHPALWRACLRLGEHAAIEYAGLEPPPDESAEPGEGSELLEQGFVVDPVEALGDVRVQDVFGTPLQRQ